MPRAGLPVELSARDKSTCDPAGLATDRSGGEAAFEAAFREHYDGLCALAARLLGCDETAQEVVQTVLLRIWRCREELAISGTLAGYLYGAVRNGALMHLRRERVERRWQERVTAEDATPLMGASPPQPDEWTRSVELTSAIQSAIQQLPPRCQKVYVLRREQDLSYAEIAQVMGISRKTVEVQIGAAHRVLRKRLAVWRD